MSDNSHAGTGPSGSKPASPQSSLQLLLSRGNLSEQDLRQFEIALKDKKEHAERSARVLAESWPDLPKDLRLMVRRWKWEGRKPESRVKACMTLGAAIVASDADAAGSFLDEAMKTLVGKGDGGTRSAAGASASNASSELRALVRTVLVEQWLQPMESAALLQIRYAMLARDSRAALEALLMDVLESRTPEDRGAVLAWLDRQAVGESSAESRHAVESLADRLRHPGGTATIAAAQQADQESLRSPSVVRDAEAKALVEAAPRQDTPHAPQTQLTQTTGPTIRPHPRVAIADSLRLIQSELKRWSTEDGDELAQLRRRASSLDDALKRRTLERDDLATALANAKDRCDSSERLLMEAHDQRDRAISSLDRLERELQAMTGRATEAESRCASVDARITLLDQELKQAREDKRKDVEYTRESERAAMTKQISQTARVHLENMHELLSASPSEKQRAALAACYEELFKVLTPSGELSNG